VRRQLASIAKDDVLGFVLPKDNVRLPETIVDWLDILKKDQPIT